MREPLGSLQNSLQDITSDHCSPQDMLLRIDGIYPPSHVLFFVVGELHKTT